MRNRTRRSAPPEPQVIQPPPRGPIPPRFDVGPNTARCPNCDWPLTRPQRGRRTRKWFRHCVNPACLATTKADAPPDQVAKTAPPRILAAGTPSGFYTFRAIYLTQNEQENDAECDQKRDQNNKE